MIEPCFLHSKKQPISVLSIKGYSYTVKYSLFNCIIVGNYIVAYRLISCNPKIRGCFCARYIREGVFVGYD